jgi:hypothetical protein
MIRATATVVLWVLSATAVAGLATAAPAHAKPSKPGSKAGSETPAKESAPAAADTGGARPAETDGGKEKGSRPTSPPDREPPADRDATEDGAPPAGPGAPAARPRPNQPPPEPSLVAPEMEATLALERARAAYEYGDMEMVVDSARIVADGRSRPTAIQRIQALRFLGIGLYLTGRAEGAEAAFFELLRQKPAAKLDPTHTRPDVVAFFESVRARHHSEIQQARPGKYFVLAFLPPAGQFQNGDRARGITLAAVEAVSLGVAIGTYAQLKSWQKRDDLTFPGHNDDAHTLKTLNNLSVAIFAATVAVGIIDGIANFHHVDDEPPLAWLTPNGLGLRF